MSDKFSEKQKRLVFLCYTTAAAKGHTLTIWNIIGGLLEFLNVFILSKTLPPSSFTKVSLKEEFRWTSAIYHDAPNNSNLLLPWSNKYLQSHKCVTRISTTNKCFSDPKCQTAQYHKRNYGSELHQQTSTYIVCILIWIKNGVIALTEWTFWHWIFKKD